MFHRTVEKDRNNVEYLRKLKEDFDRIWDMYGSSRDSDLKNQNEIEVKNQMLTMLEKFFDE